jgi:hypothetical protein
LWHRRVRRVALGLAVVTVSLGLAGDAAGFGTFYRLIRGITTKDQLPVHSNSAGGARPRSEAQSSSTTSSPRTGSSSRT